MSMPLPLDTDRLWTLDEYHALPDDLPGRIDLVEGRLRIMSMPKANHNRVAFRLQVALDSALPESWQVDYGVGVLLGDDPKKPTEVGPDIVVFSAEHDLYEGPIAPANVLLVVEVVSPSSRRKDRLEYPTYYAKAGIPYYWRVETPKTSSELRIFTYELEGATYVPAGDFADVLKVEEPFPMAFEVPALTR